jgi:hypothetical protein
LDPSLPPKILWKNLDSIDVRDKDLAPVDICPDRLNSFFTSSSNVRRPTVQRSTGSFAFSNVISRDVFIDIHRISSNAIGLDGVPLRFIKIFLPSIPLVITHIFNTSITSGCFPASWKISKVFPVAKVPDPLERVMRD